MRDAKRRAPRLPPWLIDLIDPDIDALGRGSQHHGGAQAVFMTALLLYLKLPKKDRIDLAETISARPEKSVKRDLDAHWITQAVEVISELGEAETAMFVQGMRVRSEQIRNERTAAASPKGDRRTDKRRHVG